MSHLLKQLHQKWRPAPSVHVVRGSYPVAHEGGYDWDVRAFLDQGRAQAFADHLNDLLQQARHGELGRAFGRSQRAWNLLQQHERREFEARGGWEAAREETHEEWRARHEAERQHPLHLAWHAANDEYDALAEQFMSTFPDKDLPYPRSHLMDRSNMDGPREPEASQVRLSSKAEAVPSRARLRRDANHHTSGRRRLSHVQPGSERTRSMSKFADLITITKVVDTETGIENIGDLDYRIHCNALEQWLAGGAGRLTPQTVMDRRQALAKELRWMADQLVADQDLGPFAVTIRGAEQLFEERKAKTEEWLAANASAVPPRG